MYNKVYLVLENGQIFTGKPFGYRGEAVGELVFTTGMTGYMETLTDPSYYGQIVMQTFPLIGNYGIIPEDFESSRPFLQGYVVRSWCQEPSNFRSKGDLNAFLELHRIVGIYDVDTRQITRVVRENGVMNAMITHTPDLNRILPELHKYSIKNAVASVSNTRAYSTAAKAEKLRVVLWDFGAKMNIERMLAQRNCEVITVPAASNSEQILSLHPDGIMLSNGPGDPSENTVIIKTLEALSHSRIPIFGICLGHQLLALSQGASTEKLKYGHRGANQPVIDRTTGRVYITSQNHGYMVISSSLPATAWERFVNANDGTCEGISYRNIPAFSVQFHPEAAAGPLDTSFLFDDFIHLMRTAPPISQSSANPITLSKEDERNAAAQ